MRGKVRTRGDEMERGGGQGNGCGVIRRPCRVRLMSLRQGRLYAGEDVKGKELSLLRTSRQAASIKYLKNHTLNECEKSKLVDHPEMAGNRGGKGEEAVFPRDRPAVNTRSTSQRGN